MTLADKLPAGVTASESPSQGTCTGGSKAGGTVSCTLGSLGPSQSATVTLELNAAQAGTVADTGTVSADSLDPQTANNSATADTAIGSPPNNVGLPGINGSTSPPIKGDTLTAEPGSWTGSNVEFSYQWLDCPGGTSDCSPIPGATGSTYVVAGTDVGFRIEVGVTATDAFGDDSEYSDPTDPALAGLLQVSSAQPNGGTVVLPLECADPNQAALNPFCVLLIVLSGGAVNQNALAESHGKPKPKATIYASKKVKVAAGKKVKIPVALNRAGQLLLAKRHRLVLTLTISENGHVLSTRMVTFKYKAPRKR